MTTAPTMSRPSTGAPGPSSLGRSPHPVSPSGSGAFVNIDPVRLLRRHWPKLLIAAVVGALLGFAAHIVLARVAPKYAAQVVFVVSPPVANPITLGNSPVGTNEFERFIGTQVAQMQSDIVLQAAVEYPDVKKTAWAQQFTTGGAFQTSDAVRQLRKDISASPIPMTELIRLSMKASRAEDTAVIANAVARAYLQDLQRYERGNTVERRQALSNRLRTIDDDIARYRATQKSILDEKNVITLNESLSQEERVATDINGKLVLLSAEKTALKSILERDEQQLRKTQAIVYPPAIEAAADRDPIIGNMRQQIAGLQVELRSLRERGFGEDHSTVQQFKDLIRATEIEMESKRQDTLKALFLEQLDGYRQQIEAMERQEAKLVADLEEVNKRRGDLMRTLIRKGEIDQQIETLVTEQAQIQRTIQDLETLSGGTAFDRVRISRQAQTPTSRAFPRIHIMIAAGIFLLGGLTGGLILLREVLDQRVRGPADLAVIPRLSVLGVVPEAGEDPAKPKAIETTFRDHPAGVVTESFRQIRSLLVKRMNTVGAKSLVVLGGMPGSGATSVVTNLGMSLAGLDERVLLVDGNLRRPALHKVFGLPEGPGLGDVLAGQASWAESIQESGVPNMSVLSAGTAANRAVPERLGSETMARLLGELTQQYDRVILDSSPAIVSGDGLALANRADAVALVVRAGTEKRGLVNRLRSSLGEVRGEFMGVIVNAVRSSAGGYFRTNIEATHRYQNGAKG